MTTQKALFLQAKLGEFAVLETDIPKVAKDDILVKVIATALNPVDWKVQKLGIIVEKYPAILGNEASGIVEEVGEDVKNLQKGDKVLFQGFYSTHQGTFQQYTTVPAKIAAKIPDNISFEEAATIPVGLMTTSVGFYLSEEQRGVGLTPPWQGGEGKYKGQAIVIFGGASSVGQFAIQSARLSGFSPIITTASLHNADLLKSLGATHVIDRKADVAAEVKRILPESPKIIYDAISTDTQEVAWKLLAPGGTLLLVLFPNDTLKNSIGTDGKKFFNVYGASHAQRPFSDGLYEHLHDLIASGKIIPNRVEVLPHGLAGIPTGLKRLEEGVSGVKLVVKPQETA
ncbi:hypothetical protein M422DRAFT_240596 [Sphaerobolus stellatus SS14]|nr:hypothetical protein M422DRAFT_240596 [Sphaerobolus stellatus SS14]